MAEPEIKKENTKTSIPATEVKSAFVQPAFGGDNRSQRPPMGGNRGSGDKRGFEGRKNPRKPSNRPERAKPEYDQKILNIRRVTRVVAGGKRFNFSVAMILGNRKGMVGVGTGKGGDTSMAIDKAARNAKKNLIKILLTKSMSIPHKVEAKYSSAIVMMMPAKGRGLIAGSAVRDVLDLAGIKDTSAKIFSGSKNKLNIGRATIKALMMLSKPRMGTNNKELTANNSQLTTKTN